MRNSVRQILLSGALLLGAMTALGATTPVFCGFERFRGQSDSHYETASEGAIYFDGKILFEASASRPSNADDRIVLWYRRASAAAAGELVVTAGFIDPNGLIVSRDYPVAAELEDGTYHRVTIRAVDNILEETQTLPGFIVFLDDERLACDVALTYAAEPSRFPLGWAVRERYVDGSTRAVFPSLGVKKVGAAVAAKITRAGIQGAGGARNCVLTDSVTCDEAELPVARFRAGDEYFADFDSAMDALGVLASDAEHPVLLRLLADFSPAGGVLEIPEGTYVTLDLAGHRIEGAIYVYGALEVIDTVGGGTVVGNEDEGYALCVDGGWATIRAGRWLSYLDGDALTLVAGDFFDDGLDPSMSNGGFYLDGYDYLAKGSYLAKLDYENQYATVAAADRAKVTVTFVYGASVWATSQYTANGDDWNYAVATPKATGYSFTSWLRSDGSVWTHDYSVKADQYVTAAFTNNRYTVTFVDRFGKAITTRDFTYGVYEFEMPADPTEAGQDFLGWFTTSSSVAWRFDPMTAVDITVKSNWAKHYEIIEIPRAVVGLLFDGTLKTGVVDGVGYKLTGNTGYGTTDNEICTNTATAKLDDGYKWSTGSRNEASIIWKIYKPTAFADYASAAVTNAVSGELEISADPGASVSVEGANVMITAGGITTTVPVKSYYDVQAQDGNVVITMNEQAKPTFETADSEGGDEESKSPIGITEKEFSVSLANVHPGFSYRIGTKDSLTDEWSYQPWQTVRDEATLKLSVKRDVAATSGFYVIEYTDEKNPENL